VEKERKAVLVTEGKQAPLELLEGRALSSENPFPLA